MLAKRNPALVVEEGDVWIDGCSAPARSRRRAVVYIFSIATIGLIFAAQAVAQEPGGGDGGTSFKDLATGVGAAVGAVLALLGAPSIYLGVKKSQAEIRKLELETARLVTEQGDSASTDLTVAGRQTYNVLVDGHDNSVSIVADPRLLGPLLLLLDFVTATIVLTIAGYLLNFGGLSVFSPVLALIAAALFTPIYREARRLKRVLSPEAREADTSVDEEVFDGGSA